jgi:hypothetical protein
VFPQRQSELFMDISYMSATLRALGFAAYYQRDARNPLLLFVQAKVVLITEVSHPNNER